MTDGELVGQALTGGPAARTAAYGHLARRWAVRVMAVCHARLGSQSAAEDLTQETLLRGLRSLPTLDDPDKFGPWLCGIASRACLDWLKAARHRGSSIDNLFADGTDHEAASLIDPADDAPTASSRREQIEQLMVEVERLPAAYRQVLMRYYYEPCTYQELADELGVSAATINARLTKARMMLRARLMSASEKER
jgi:RNA polymerase sigma-70 factor (ECF subfamily)